jgi:8-oxo-dGTP diphosphatase
MIVVAAGIIVRAEEVLACRRPQGGPHPLKWEFPGGKREAGETLPQCLRRELREELGIRADVGRELYSNRHDYPERQTVEIHFFLVPVYRGSLVNRGFAEIRWVAVEDLRTLDFLDGDREFIFRLERREVDLTG